MKINSLLCFLTTCASGLLLGCGGGNSSSGTTVPSGTAYLVSADSKIMSPKLMTLLGTDIYIANQHNTGVNGILKVNSADGLSAVGFAGLNDTIGITSNNIVSNNLPEIYISGKDSSGLSTFLSSTGTPLALIVGSHYGMAFDSSNRLYAAFVAGPTASVGISYPAYTSWNKQFSVGETPKAFAFKSNLIYFTTDEGSIYKLTPDTITPIRLTLNRALELPNGIAFDGDVIYVANKGNANGSSSWIAKITNESNVEVFKRDSNWLCGSAGIAVRNNYIYVSNGTTTGSCGTIPGTNTSVQNTIVKFFH